jgi:hypothetical protein
MTSFRLGSWASQVLAPSATGPNPKSLKRLERSEAAERLERLEPSTKGKTTSIVARTTCARLLRGLKLIVPGILSVRDRS